MRRRIKIHIQGMVQGVGFRPYIYNLAQSLELTGWVNNSAQGVTIDAEGDADTLLEFVDRIRFDQPPHAHITHFDWTWDDLQDYDQFEIHHSDEQGVKSALILPDLAICPDCLREIFDPNNRRYRYPFTNCTHCGPRFSIIQALPYDRANTTMTRFTMCEACQSEYDDPSNRRFHAQPNACPNCGPKLMLWDKQGKTLAEHDEALMIAAELIRLGKIVACKGLGGFHLMVDARNNTAVQCLRERKNRPQKPLATLFPSLESVQACCDVNETEARILQSAAAPIVLLRLRKKSAVSKEVAPNNPYLGVMLPYTPLHVLLMDELGFPIVVTSGNVSNESICIDNDEAVERLGDIADVFLVHDRPIERPIDDSVVQIVQDEIQVLRLARGYAPLSLELDESSPATLAVGAHLKSAICIGNERQIVLSQHIGDLETPQTFATFQRTVKDFQHLYEIQPDCIAHDLHPDYLSTQYAQDLDRVWNPVQHHVAHVLSGMIDNDIKGDALAVAWDGTGYGMDKTIWGGEWFKVNRTSVERIAHLAPFPLPGGDIAVREPRRSALGALYATYGAATFQLDITPIKHYDVSQRRILDKMLEKGFNAPQTSSMGRLFDAVASLLNLQQVISFEGQAAMAVEFAAMKSRDSDSYPFTVSIQQVDWRPMIQALVEDSSRHTPTNVLAARFLNTLIEMIVAVAHVIGEKQVLLTGGCFQNRLLTEGAINRLRQEGFTPYWHHQVPPNDGGIAVGQLTAVAHKINVRSDALCV